MIEFSLAVIDDAEAVMGFIDRYWRKDHILATDRRLFLYDFQEGEALNFGLARDQRGQIVGIFGFMKYNSLPVPDIAGSFWKVLEQPDSPMLGLRLRKFVTRQVAHRFFAAPGAGLQTRPIYRAIGMHWHRMQHYYRLNPASGKSILACVPPTVKSKAWSAKIRSEASRFHLRRLVDPAELASFDFAAHSTIVPFKDAAYLRRRFFEHPVYRYDVFGLEAAGAGLLNLIVTRRVGHAGASALRIVDFYGSADSMEVILHHLDAVMIEAGDEYVDFVCHGFPPELMTQAGFQCLDFQSDEVVVPNYFEPFEKKNVPVYCVSDPPGALTFRQCRADGDQDRPNQSSGQNKRAADAA